MTSAALSGRFRDRLTAVAAFRAEHGRLPSKGRVYDDRSRLGVWLVNQRRRNDDGRMTVAERQALEAALGPWWTLPPTLALYAEHGEPSGGGRLRSVWTAA